MQTPVTADARAVAASVRAKAEDLFRSGEMLCAPAVFTTLNQAFDGGLDGQTARHLTAGLPDGMRGSGCVCGALSGAQLGLGLILGQGNGAARRTKTLARDLHDQFKAEFGSTCCRVLTKKAGSDPESQQAKCIRCTGHAAEAAARLILAARPELAAGRDLARPSGRAMGGALVYWLRRLARGVGLLAD